ncbi:MAG: hypothetical protein HN764_04390 [Gammaproteobacteria bacterium]|jgi:hypothetical protein|nr:hypothetical protein [Gammaproteobacteria bacterium]
MKINNMLPAILLLFALIPCNTIASSMENEDIWFFVLVKSNNYSQDQDGNLKLLNFHFFSELFGKEPGKIKSATLARTGSNADAFVYEDRGETFYYEGGHYNTVEAVDAAHPNGEYQFDISLASGKNISANMNLSGPSGKTDIPAPVEISFYQDGKKASQKSIDPALPLRVTWSPYSNGQADKNGIVDDMIFVVFQSCQGERVYHTGLPFKEADYTKYDVTELTVPANSFKSGQTYALFVEFPHVVDSKIANGIPGFTSYATATYADIDTTGETEANSCPDEIPPLDTGQTDRMDVEINE